MPEDISFENRCNLFQKNIYAKPKGWLREKVLWKDMTDHIPLIQEPGRVLDCGGGLGQIACRLAKQGHQITFNDLSSDMVKQTREHIKREGLESHFQFEVGPFQDLSKQSYDLVMCHAVLEWLASPMDSLEHLVSFLKPGGHLSLMVYNLHGLVFHKVTQTHFFDVLKVPPVSKIPLERNPEYKSSRFTPPNPIDPESVIKAMEAFPVKLISTAGIRMFYDYMQNRETLSSIPDGLLQLEFDLKNVAPYRHFGRYIHLIFSRNQPEAPTLNDPNGANRSQ